MNPPTDAPTEEPLPTPLLRDPPPPPGYVDPLAGSPTLEGTPSSVTQGAAAGEGAEPEAVPRQRPHSSPSEPGTGSPP